MGDFNLNPFENLMTNTAGLNAVSCRTTAQRRKKREGKDFFYNPCWNLLGDQNLPPGTYYYSSCAEPIWHLLD